MDQTQLETLERLPAPQSVRRIDFDEAEVIVLDTFPPQYILLVRGTKPYANMKVELIPLVYIRQPEYWGIEVVGFLGGIGLPVVAPYSVSLPLAGVTGTRGVEVIGATRRQKLAVPPETQMPQGSFSLAIASPDGRRLAEATLTCNPTGGTHPNAGAACEQLSRVAGRIEDIPPKDGICTEIFQPVVLSAEGTWDGEPRSFSREFGNRCQGVLATGGVVFEFGDTTS
jgi:hypothetical protein